MSMPSYFYHLKFELYPTPTPTATKGSLAAGDRPPADIWLPPKQADVFDDLPSHPRADRQTSQTTPTGQSHRNPGSRTFEQTPGLEGADPSVIDCGVLAAPARGKELTIEPISERQWLERSQSFPPPPPSAALRPQTAVNDWRFGRVSINTIDVTMAHEASNSAPAAAPSLGPTALGDSGIANKAEFLPVKTKNTECGWGIVHFYREGEETTALDTVEGDGEGETADGASNTADCTTLCIPAVPAYMTPGDFLGFVGERWSGDIIHCRMVMTSKQNNKYLALLKFRNVQRAKQWRQEFDGKLFNTFQPQACHVVFVKKITFETPSQPNADHSVAGSSSAVSSSLKPFPPPTPNLIELPTCPVCLERMDETNGLMTIPCSHVFHCTCLQNWKGAGCPVCRFTNASQGDVYDPANPYTHPFGSDVSNLCTVCDCTDDLWICLICGRVGCGRYKGAHAKDHWKETAHSFALELETQHVWDYAGDMWVHRLIREKGDGKVVELPSRNDHQGQQSNEDVVPREKLETIGLEYTNLITSQLETQRAYYEEMISKAVDKASQASAAADSASSQASMAMENLNALDKQYQTLTKETIPQLERDLERERNKAAKTQDLARNLGKSLQEEKRISEGLMKRVEHLNVDNETARKQTEELKAEVAELKEMNRDLSMYISGQEKLKEMESEGQIGEGELEGGQASVPGKKKTRRGTRGKGRAISHLD